jgi:hypothetical protein
LFDLLLVGLLSGVAGSAPLIHFLPMAFLILTGETPQSLFFVLAGRRLL